MTSLAVLARVLPPEAIEEVDGLLSDAEAAKLAMAAADLERFRSSPHMAKVPADALACHAVADMEIDAKKGVAQLELDRKERTRAQRDEVSRVNALYAHVVDALTEIAKQASRNVVAYNQAERARVQRERDEQQRREAEAARAEADAIAAAEAASTEEDRHAAMARAEQASMAIAVAQVEAPKDAPRAYKSAAGTSSITKRWKLAAFDPDKVPQSYYRHEKVQAALRSVLEAAVRAGFRDIEGVTVEEVEGTRTR